jgi:RimJ/RimL family protein N-acetyltransferase
MAVTLTPFAEAHLAAIPALADDPDTGRFTRIPIPAPPGFPRAWLDMYEQGRRDGTREAFAVVDDEDGSFLGLALAPVIEADDQTVELGYVIAPHARGRGVATGALRLLTEWAFSELGAERAELLISVDNTASKIVAERSGYVREGVLRSMYVKQGIREDLEIWSRLPSDPPPR